MPTSSLSSGGTGSDLLGIPVEEEVEDGDQKAISRMTVTKWPIRRTVFPCLIAARFEHRWNVIPYIYDDVQACWTSSFLFQEPWVKALYELAETELEPLLRYATDLTNVAHAKITREAVTRCNYFSRFSPDAFFYSKESYLRWLMASSWAAWEASSLLTHERVADLNAVDPTIKLTPKAFLAICDALALPQPSKARRGQTTVDVPRTALARETTAVEDPPQTPLLTEQERELMLLRDWSPEKDDVFSYGGPPELSFDTDPAISDHFNVGDQKDVAIDGLAKTRWWWRSAFHNLTTSVQTRVEHEPWPDEWMSLFRDNWERSAFLYEFRARYGGGRQSDLFGKPWVKLSNSQRGVLACMWPVGHTGGSQITPQLHPFVVSQIKSKIRLHLVVDASTPDKDVSEMVLAKLNEERRKRNLSRPKAGSGRPRPLPWSALELLDARNLGGVVLNDAQRGSLSHATKIYKKACQEFGIEP